MSSYPGNVIKLFFRKNQRLTGFLAIRGRFFRRSKTAGIRAKLANHLRFLPEAAGFPAPCANQSAWARLRDAGPSPVPSNSGERIILYFPHLSASRAGSMNVGTECLRVPPSHCETTARRPCPNRLLIFATPVRRQGADALCYGVCSRPLCSRRKPRETTHPATCKPRIAPFHFEEHCLRIGKRCPNPQFLFLTLLTIAR